jgi:formate hydrogenlyase subunit 3/multisubunit Na+/H+ antiporter MnhD subunit
MSASLVLLPPLLLLPLLLHGATRTAALRLAPWAPLPALMLALLAPADAAGEWSGVLLGSVFGLDATGRLFLTFTALVWLLAGLYARVWLRPDARAWRFWAFYLATQAGNLGVCLALDALSFYLWFALMTFAAYGLVVYERTPESLRAGRIYLIMAVLGEALLVAGLLLAVHAAGDERFDAIAGTAQGPVTLALLIAGLGVKVGVPLLHMWLPLAHPVAPVPASAVLSGVMLKAGLLGWLRLLPLGNQAAPEAGALLMAAGLLAMLLGVGAGLMQRNAKVLLAYSSISQMGYTTLGVGAGLLAPAAWPLLLSAVSLYALHHALAKSALFLGVGLIHRQGGSPAALAGLTLPVLALAGAPLTSGMPAKQALKLALAPLPAPWPELLALLLPLAALGTALLMLRLVWLQAGREGQGGGDGLAPPWALSLLAVAGVVWMVAPALPQATAVAAWAASWPVLLALVTAYAAARTRRALPLLPPGDLIVPLEAAASRLTALFKPGAARPQRSARPPVARWARAEALARRWPLAGTLWLALLTALLLALLM